MAIKITYTNQKGGCGKTTTAVSTAAFLSKKFKVLLIDLDGQNNASSSLGVAEAEVNSYTVFKGGPIKVVSVNNNLDLLPSSINVSSLDTELVNEPGREQLLREILESVEDQYHYIIMDTSPNLGLISVNALVASDYFVVVILPHQLSIQGVSKLIEASDKIKRRINSSLKLGGFVITQYSSRKVLHKNISQSISNHFPGKLFETTIPENISLAEAPTSKQSIMDYAPSSKGAIAYEQLTREIINKLK